jgi:uncharacterized protein (DUF58 family)
MNVTPDPLPGRGSLVDPRALMRLGSLELRARVVVEGFWNGLHRSPYHGFSVEFTEYRQYTPGDDPRYLDWRVLGRSDRYFIKKFEDETNLRCHLVVDQSRSMAFGSAGYSKAAYAATLAGTLAYFLHRQGDATGLLTFDAEVRDYLPARHRPGHLRRLLLTLERAAEGRATSLPTPLRRLADIVRKRGLVIVISDFLAPLEDLERSLAALAAGGHEILVFQVLDPAEVTLEFAGPTLFEDLESGRTLYIDPATARRDYRERIEAHGTALGNLCRRHGIGFTRLVSNEPIEHALFAFLQERARRGRWVRHRAPAPGGTVA